VMLKKLDHLSKTGIGQIMTKVTGSILTRRPVRTRKP
jgi:hypothetical protein